MSLCSYRCPGGLVGNFDSATLADETSGFVDLNIEPSLDYFHSDSQSETMIPMHCYGEGEH